MVQTMVEVSTSIIQQQPRLVSKGNIPSVQSPAEYIYHERSTCTPRSTVLVGSLRNPGWLSELLQRSVANAAADTSAKHSFLYEDASPYGARNDAQQQPSFLHQLSEANPRKSNISSILYGEPDVKDEDVDIVEEQALKKFNRDLRVSLFHDHAREVETKLVRELNQMKPSKIGKRIDSHKKDMEKLIFSLENEWATLVAPKLLDWNERFIEKVRISSDQERAMHVKKEYELYLRGLENDAQTARNDIFAAAGDIPPKSYGKATPAKVEEEKGEGSATVAVQGGFGASFSSLQFLSHGMSYIGPYLYGESDVKGEDRAFEKFKEDLRIQMVVIFHALAKEIKSEPVKDLTQKWYGKHIDSHTKDMERLRISLEREMDKYVQKERQVRLSKHERTTLGKQNINTLAPRDVSSEIDENLIFADAGDMPLIPSSKARLERVEERGKDGATTVVQGALNRTLRDVSKDMPKELDHHGCGCVVQ